MRALLFVALALLALAGTTQPAVAQPLCHGWYPAEDGKLDLYWRGEHIGSLDPLKAIWQTAGKANAIDLVQTFGIGDPHPGGVQAASIDQGPSYEINGRKTSKAAALKVLTGDGLTDDRAKPFLTAVLPEAQRQQFRRDLETSAALQPWRGKIHTNDYAPSDWQVKQIGLSEGVSFQGPPDAQGKSKVLFRLRSYEGPEILAQALRKADGGYTPDKDPDPTKQPPDGGKSPTPPDGGTTIDTEAAATWGGFGVGMASILTWVLRRRYAS